MLIVYSNRIEFFVCEPEVESKLLDLWFAETSGRNVQDYHRDEVSSGMVGVGPRLSAVAG